MSICMCDNCAKGRKWYQIGMHGCHFDMVELICNVIIIIIDGHNWPGNVKLNVFLILTLKTCYCKLCLQIQTEQFGGGGEYLFLLNALT